MDLTRFCARVESRSATIGIVGLGYVGLPLALTFAEAGFKVLGYDTNQALARDLRRGQSHIKHIPHGRVHAQRERFFAYADPYHMAHCDVVIVCVPTPIGPNRQPELRHILGAAGKIGPFLQAGQLLVLESTTYPGTTQGIFREALALACPMLQRSPDAIGLAYSPEREDPGNSEYNTQSIPKVVSGSDEASLTAIKALYGQVFSAIVPTTSTQVAEMAKILENTYRLVNIALVNELKMVCTEMGIDIWDVIRAAKTKPFGFQAFYPGPGLGGHCIPIDPLYLTWKAREHGQSTHLIEMATEINESMPAYVLGRVAAALNELGTAVKGSKILILGVAYKRNIEDTRESPAIRIIAMLRSAGAEVSYHDPHVAHLPEHDMHSVKLDAPMVGAQNVVLLITDHMDVDYPMISDAASLIVDTRGIFPNRKNVVRA